MVQASMKNSMVLLTGGGLGAEGTTLKESLLMRRVSVAVLSKVI
jgi:hypothetical protein